MDIYAKAKFARISPKKAQPLVRSLRGQKVLLALAGLKKHPTKTSQFLYKLIYSAMSNAQNNYNLKKDNLKIKRLTVDDGPRMKRYWFRSHGSADQLLKRSSHFEVILTEITPTLVKKPVAKQAVEAKPQAKVGQSKPTTGPTPPSAHVGKPTKSNVAKAHTQRTTNK